MKRTKNIRHERFRKVHHFWRYTAIAVVVSGAFALQGCDQYSDESVSVYKTVQQCLQDNPNDKGQCNSDYLAAQQKSASTAPKYTSKDDCDDEFGIDSCVTQAAPNGSMFWYPIMSGYTRGTGSYVSQPMYSSSKYSSPMYNKFVDAKGNDYGNFYAAPKRTVPTEYVKAKGESLGVVRRGGFGSTVRSAAFSSSHSSGTSSHSSFHSSGGHSFGG